MRLRKAYPENPPTLVVGSVKKRIIIKFWHRGIKTFIPYAIPGFIILILANTGALLQNNILIYAMIAGICVVVGLVAFNKLKEPYYPHIVWAVGLALLLQTSLMSPGLIGSDVHTEYFFYYNALGGWDYTNPHPYNSAIGSTLFAPFLTNVFHIPGYWIFKLVFPCMFAFVPILLYFIFRKEFGAKVAFFVCIFFVMVPTWSLELTGIPRQMLGELMLGICFFLVLVSKWRLRLRIPLLVVVATLGAMMHYIMGPLIVLFFGVGGFLLLFFRRRVFPLKWLSLALVIILLCSVAFYGAVCDGMPLYCLIQGTGIVQSLVSRILPIPEPPTIPESVVPDSYYEIEERPEVDIIVEPTGGYFAHFSPLIRAAWGADFNEANIWGKVFRVFQYLTQLAIVVGLIFLIKDRKKYSAEYLSLCGASILLLGACMFVPYFAAIINATRFYHIALLLSAPLFVLGGKFIFRSYKLLAVCLIIPYFLFTSGLVFEATQQTDIATVNMPYSIILSNHRVDMVGVFTKNDMAVRDWAIDNNLGAIIYADTHSQLLLWEKEWSLWKDLRVALRTGEFKTGDYIFLSERNNRDRAIILRPRDGTSTSGRRESYSYEEIGLDKYFTKDRIVYQQGNACILEVKSGASRPD